jgi:hypothetical protein
MSESELQENVSKTLRDLNIPFYHASSRAARQCVCLKNMPDIIFFKGGESYCLELKSKGGRLSSGQEKELKRLHEEGMHVKVIFTYDGFLETMKDWGLIKY